jgi:Leucine-rich repeat (LRR) protein
MFQASFRNKSLSWENVDGLIARLNSLTALDLSSNRIDRFPNVMTSSLTALDLSYNSVAVFPTTNNRIGNLVELRLRGNHITE